MPENLGWNGKFNADLDYVHSILDEQKERSNRQKNAGSQLLVRPREDAYLRYQTQKDQCWVT